MKTKIVGILIVLVSIVVVSSVNASTPGDWTQNNVSGFGDVDNYAVLSLASFNGTLYAGTANGSGDGAQFMKFENNGWVSVSTNGFGNVNNDRISDLIEFKNNLYAGTGNETDGGQILRSNNGTTWDVVTPPTLDPSNGEFVHFAVFDEQIYASTSSITVTQGAEIWRSSTGNSGSWSQVVTNGFGDVNNKTIITLHQFNGKYYAGTDNTVTGTEVWCSNDGTSWSQVNADGFGDTYNWGVVLQGFSGYLYAGTYNYAASDNPGSELWRCQICDGTDWQQFPVAKGFGDTENRAIRSLIIYNNELYAATYNRTSGIEVWASSNGIDWEQVNVDGFGNSDNIFPYWDNSTCVFDGGWYVGTWNHVSGGEVWKYVQRHTIYLPLILKDAG